MKSIIKVEIRKINDKILNKPQYKLLSFFNVKDFTKADPNPKFIKFKVPNTLNKIVKTPYISIPNIETCNFTNIKLVSNIITVINMLIQPCFKILLNS